MLFNDVCLARLDELLRKYPPEEVEAQRWKKIAADLGNRTPAQASDMWRSDCVICNSHVTQFDFQLYAWCYTTMRISLYQNYFLLHLIFYYHLLTLLDVLS